MRAPQMAWILACGLLTACGCRPAASASKSPAPASAGGEHPGEQGKTASAASEAAALGTVYGPDTTTIEARPGERFSLALPKDAGRSWKLDPDLDQSVARVVEQRSDGGTHYVLFDAVGIGPTDLRLRQRGGDTPAPGPAAREVTIRVRVESVQ